MKLTRLSPGLLPLSLLPLLVLPLGCADKPEQRPAGTGELVQEGGEAPVPLAPATYYYPDDTGMLSPEGGEAPASPVELRIRRLVETLIAGPQETTGVLHAPLPKETTVGGVLVLDGVAYVDLRGLNDGPPPAVGSMDEQMILYSLIDTIVLNSPPVERVVLLWNGSQRETFAGHFDTTRPLPADSSLIVSR